jgi:RES domain-containing protein
MKCLKSGKTKEIIRITDVKAENMVGFEWKYVSKSEWKSATRQKVEEKVVETQTIAEKQLKRKKSK